MAGTARMTGESESGLSTRAGLPEPLRILLKKYPRGKWESHPNFVRLTRFWLDRHRSFRRTLGQLQEVMVRHRSGALSDSEMGAQVSRLAGSLFTALDSHHRIEEHHYFPKLVEREPALAEGIRLLDEDHAQMERALSDLARRANTMLAALADGPAREEAADFEKALAAFTRLLNRHLTDEEDLVVPVVLEHGSLISG